MCKNEDNVGTVVRESNLDREDPFISNGVKHLKEIKAPGLETPNVNQIELDPWCQQKPIVEYQKKNSIVIEAYSPFTVGEYLDDAYLIALAKKVRLTNLVLLSRLFTLNQKIPFEYNKDAT
ncbi:hypothetical protein FRB97_008027 [Tulasnella sp. 331]|nr:hypothetical protein FRB97_008027 [Tulasnella sp. 331]